MTTEVMDKQKLKKRIVIILDYYVYRNYIDYICYLFHFRPHIPFTIHTVVHVTSGLYADTGQCCPILYVLLPITISPGKQRLYSHSS